MSTYAQKPNVDFFDISHHNMQNGLPLSFFQTIKSSAGVNSVVIKVSEGDYFLDNAASVNVANAKSANLVVSAYHFARFTSIQQKKKQFILIKSCKLSILTRKQMVMLFLILNLLTYQNTLLT
jgi:GH25 family lysozyme M1 (1,4-beta-N-acetylmuramidase)